MDEDELYFILGWCNTKQASVLLKEYINHTKNIQGKDIERLPYPFWVLDKERCVAFVKGLIAKAKQEEISEDDLAQLDQMYIKE